METAEFLHDPEGPSRGLNLKMGSGTSCVGSQGGRNPSMMKLRVGGKWPIKSGSLKVSFRPYSRWGDKVLVRHTSDRRGAVRVSVGGRQNLAFRPFRCGIESDQGEIFGSDRCSDSDSGAERWRENGEQKWIVSRDMGDSIPLKVGYGSLMMGVELPVLRVVKELSRCRSQVEPFVCRPRSCRST
jgi:hypothetical protein